MMKKLKNLFTTYDTKEKFFTLIEQWLSVCSEEYRMIERSYDDAYDAFALKKRENGDEYFEHIRAVAIIIIAYLYIFERKDLSMPAHKIVIAAILHDIVEDCPEWTLKRVRREYDDEIAIIIDYVSKRSAEEFDDSKEKALIFYHNRLRLPSVLLEVLLVKLADRLHNLMTLWVCKKEKIKRKIRETRDIYIPLARERGVLVQEIQFITSVLSKEYL